MDLPVYMRLNLNAEMAETYRIQGPKGILEVGEFGLNYRKRFRALLL